MPPSEEERERNRAAYAAARQKPAFQFPGDTYSVDGALLRAVEALMRRLYTEQRMNADEMRDWANKLYAMLGSRVHGEQS